MIEIFIHMLIIFEICIYIYLPGSCKQSLQWFSIGVSQSPIYIREFPNHLYVWYALCLVDLLMVMMIARRWRWCSPWWKHPNRRWPRCAGCWRLRCSTGTGSGRTGSSWTSCLRPMNEWMISWYWLWPIGAVHILRQPPEGGEGVWQILTIADEGGRGGKPNADHCWRRGEGGARNPWFWLT